MRLLRALLLLPLLCASCQDKPQAPPLRDDPVFDDARTGIRFLAPTGWIQSARSELPSGPLDRDWLLVRYQPPPGEKAALFEVTVLDAPETADVAELVAAPSHSLGPWKPANPPQAITLGPVDAMRHTVICKNSTKESVVVRRGNRLWFLTGVFGVSDPHAHATVRQIVQGVTWRE